ncbi:MAG: alkaline phosphatase family protein [bacterium]|nr:alkaline phosphatase family protein [bacterium]
MSRLLVLLPLLCGLFAIPAHAETNLTKIAFGSCIQQSKPQPIWQAVNAWKPQLFLLIGDNIYGDSEDMEVLKAKYEELGKNPGFSKLRRTCQLMAVWDDHDYGVNDGGVEYPKKAESQQVFNDFFGTPAQSPRRKREGIYDSVIYGSAPHRVQIILLDTRYFRSKLKGREGGKTETLGPYIADDSDDATMLGKEQWSWLAGELEKEAEVRIIASSVQAVPIEHGWEGWGTFPKERKKLFDLIAEKKAGGAFFISGDRHMAEISRETEETPYPIYDATSSSLNQPSMSKQDEPNKRRVGDNFREANFGTIDIDWTEDPNISIAIRNLKGDVVRAHSMRLSELQPK